MYLWCSFRLFRFLEQYHRNGLSVSASAPGKQVASKFTRSADDHLLYAVSVSDNELKYRYDADTKRRRFIREKTDVWQPFSLKAGKYTQSVTFSRVDYNREYSRGQLAGINGGPVTSLFKYHREDRGH
jgi:hypothetical protein